MKQKTFVGWTVLAVAAVVGCKPQEEAKAPSTPAAEVRGAPIASKVEKPAAPAPVAEAKPAPASSSPAVAAKSATTPAPGDPMALGFDKLASFVYEMPDETLGKPETAKTNTVSQIPKNIQALNQQKVALKGFMLPLKVEGGLVTELLLMKDQSMCCYGAVPKITEWVSVKMLKEGVKPVMDQPVTLHGQLKVGEIRENGFLVGIYAMDGERMVGPLDM